MPKLVRKEFATRNVVALAEVHYAKRIMLLESPAFEDTTNLSMDGNVPQSILERIARGDSQAVEDCLDQYGGLVWTIAQRYCRSKMDSEDITQEIFVELWRKAHTFDPSRSSEVAFVTMIARRRLIDRLRRSSAQPDVTSLSDDSAGAFSEDLFTPQPTEAAELADEAAKASRCLEKLPDTQQQVISLSIHQGVSHSGISSRLSLPLGTVKSYARRALIQLKDCMNRESLPSARGGVT